MDKTYEILDRPEVAAAIFHPRPDLEPAPRDKHISDHLIAVDTDIHVGGRFHTHSQNGANLLYFHGNGEIASDYDQLGPLFGKLNINLMAVDYRGYGRSTGRPTVSAMMAAAMAASRLSWNSLYTSSGKVCVRPARLPAKRMVAPNSPSARAQASTSPAPMD